MPQTEIVLTPAVVDRLMGHCLYGEGRPADGAILVQGIVRNFGFDRDRIAESLPEIERLIGELPPPFLMSEGGGWSFLNLCQDRHDQQWTGSHATMEALCCLAIAAERAAWLLPREMWGLLPGSMPYVGFQIGRAVEVAEAA